uniref:Lipocalin n=1 Tax=Rhipicephalus zambeziensis TaxID=60191 RepID=A0A224YHP1_9ACAR
MTVYGQQKFPRTYETRAFLTQRGYSYLVGTTGPVNLSDRCMRSYYLYVSGSEISHQLKYVEPESEEAETNSVEYYERHPKRKQDTAGDLSCSSCEHQMPYYWLSL